MTVTAHHGPLDQGTVRGGGERRDVGDCKDVVPGMLRLPRGGGPNGGRRSIDLYLHMRRSLPTSMAARACLSTHSGAICRMLTRPNTHSRTQ